jgi:transposase InsO family protein
MGGGGGVLRQDIPDRSLKT